MLDLFEQDRNSTVGAGGSVDDYEVNHDYDDRGGAGGRKTVIRTQTTYPDGVVVSMEEADNASSIGDSFEQARTHRVKVGATTVSEYAYLGMGAVVGTELPQPDVFSRRYTGAATYGELDRFNRPVTWTWTKDLTSDVNFYDVDIAYDENGNITRTEDNVHTAGAAGSGNGLFDVAYTMDGVNRLTQALEGHWGGSSISSAKRDEIWTLDQTGNWEFFKRDLNGDLDYTDTDELKDRRTHNVVNELLTRDTDDNSSVNYTQVYDDNGNMTDDGQRYTYKYDAFGRLKEVRNRSNTNLVAEYKYNGLGYRIGWHYDTDTDGTVESNTDDPWYLFVYDDEWRILNTYRMLDWAYNASNPVAANAKERFVYHNAGLGGWGESSYIDSVMLRDRDADTAWNAASDGTMEERVYYAQNWRHDVSALVTDDGRMIEWIKYSSYGVPWSLPAADTDSDGDFDTTDSGALSGTYDVRKDVNLDGAVDVLDFLDAFDLNNGLSTLGWSKLGATKWGNRKGYAGYEGDTALAGTKWHVRHRVLESELGRWTKRDPIEHQLSNNVMFYADSRPLHLVDPAGLSPIVMRDDPGLESPNPVPPHPCAANFKKALSDPQVIAAKAAAAAHCPGGTLPAIFLSTCNGGGEFSCGPLSTSIGVCIGDAGSDGGGGCPTASSMVRTILHELTHYKQFCGTGAGYMGIPENGGSCTQWILSHAFGPVKTIREMQAYCEVEYSSMCPPTTWSNADFICRMVEHSGGSYCLCMTLFGYNGGARCVPPPPPPWWSPSIITLAGEIAEM